MPRRRVNEKGQAGLIHGARPLRRLTDTVRDFDIDAAPVALPVVSVDELASRQARPNDEIVVLERAFRQMVERLGTQWRTLTRQDQERRELIANISHDLRTPLSSLHGYLETLSLKDATLTADERRRYLGIALDQSRKVGALAQSLFELARLEHGFVQPEAEPFSVTDLIQDVFQKFELSAESRGVALRAELAPQIPAARADLGLIERVFTNLLDNALRYTPAGGEITVTVAPVGTDIEVLVSDTGPGIPQSAREGLFERPFTVGGARREGGLGLRIVHRILQLHDRRITLVDTVGNGGQGATFRFTLPT